MMWIVAAYLLTGLAIGAVMLLVERRMIGGGNDSFWTEVAGLAVFTVFWVVMVLVAVLLVAVIAAFRLYMLLPGRAGRDNY